MLSECLPKCNQKVVLKHLECPENVLNILICVNSRLLVTFIIFLLALIRAEVKDLVDVCVHYHHKLCLFIVTEGSCNILVGHYYKVRMVQTYL